jgi:hypothetical protein
MAHTDHSEFGVPLLVGLDGAAVESLRAMRTRRSLRFWSCWIPFALCCLGCVTTDPRIAARDRAWALAERADRYVAEGDYEQAEPLYQESLAIREGVLGPDNPEVARILYDMAWL